MASSPLVSATIDDLYEVDGKAELIGGRIVHIMPAGDLPGFAAEEIFVSLRLHSKQIQKGVAHGDGVGFTVQRLLSGRESFCPDASYYSGSRPANPMRFIHGAPDFAAEVRSKNDYGPTAESALAAKRADYFEAGTQVVWDVDPVNKLVHVYRASAPDQPDLFRLGEVVDAEPAVPGWTMKVDDIFGE